MISIEQAFQKIAEHVLPLPVETITLTQAVGRILTADILADVDSPPHRKSVMDGFAVRSADINSGNKRLTVIETVVAGGWPEKELQSGHATRIMTGAAMPIGADAVAMIEVCAMEQNSGTNFVAVELDSIEPGKHTMNVAENFSASQTMFRIGHRVRATDVGLLAEVGADRLQVGGRPRVAILPTGNELVNCHLKPERGQIRNSNGPMLIAMAQQLGLPTTDLGIARDDRDELSEKITAGLKHDLLILSGGVSAGLLDLVPQMLQDAGVVEVFHQVKVKPGKPIWFGVLNRAGQRCLVFGLPGNPVSSLVGFHLFVRTALRYLESATETQPKKQFAELTTTHETRGDRPTFWPGRWSDDESCLRRVEPLVWRGSSDLLALGAADGLIFFPGDSQLHSPGERVAFYPF